MHRSPPPPASASGGRVETNCSVHFSCPFGIILAPDTTHIGPAGREGRAGRSLADHTRRSVQAYLKRSQSGRFKGEIPIGCYLCRRYMCTRCIHQQGISFSACAKSFKRSFLNGKSRRLSKAIVYPRCGNGAGSPDCGIGCIRFAAYTRSRAINKGRIHADLCLRSRNREQKSRKG